MEKFFQLFLVWLEDGASIVLEQQLFFFDKCLDPRGHQFELDEILTVQDAFNKIFFRGRVDCRGAHEPIKSLADQHLRKQVFRR